MATKLQLVDVAADVLHRIDPQLPGWRQRAEKVVDELLDQGLIRVDGVRGWQGAPVQAQLDDQ